MQTLERDRTHISLNPGSVLANELNCSNIHDFITRNEIPTWSYIDPMDRGRKVRWGLSKVSRHGVVIHPLRDLLEVGVTRSSKNLEWGDEDEAYGGAGKGGVPGADGSVQ